MELSLRVCYLGRACQKSLALLTLDRGGMVSSTRAWSVYQDRVWARVGMRAGCVQCKLQHY